MKKTILIVVCVLAVLGIAAAGFMIKAGKVMREIDIEHAGMGDVSLLSLNDGVYNGRFGSIPVFVDLEVTIKDHAIQNISIKKQRSGRGYQARETVQRIIASQKPKVDAVSGATISSKCIMLAVYKALAGGQL